MRIFLLRYMRDHGVGQADMAKLMGVSPSYVSMLINGRALPRIPTAIKIARRLGVSMDDLLSVKLPLTEREEGQEKEDFGWDSFTG